jgi:hypothetical protein
MSLPGIVMEIPAACWLTHVGIYPDMSLLGIVMEIPRSRLASDTAIARHLVAGSHRDL